MLPSLSFKQRVKSLGNLREEVANDDDADDVTRMRRRPSVGAIGHNSAPPTQSGYSDSDSGHGGDAGTGRSRTPVQLRRNLERQMSGATQRQNQVRSALLLYVPELLDRAENCCNFM